MPGQMGQALFQEKTISQQSCEGSNEVSHKDMHRQGQSIPSRSSQHKDTKEKFPKHVALLVEKTNNR